MRDMHRHQFGFRLRTIFYSLIVSDLNSDQFPDLVTVDFEANTLSVALGKDPSNFSE